MNKLERLPEPRPIPEGNYPTTVFQIRDLTNKLNEAINHIVELEARYESHTHSLPVFNPATLNANPSTSKPEQSQ